LVVVVLTKDTEEALVFRSPAEAEGVSSRTSGSGCRPSGRGAKSD
jgi:hypothetical protein